VADAGHITESDLLVSMGGQRRLFVLGIVIGRIVAIHHHFAGLADSQFAGLSKRLARNELGAGTAEDLSTQTTMMFPSESREPITTSEAHFGILVFHPEITAQNLMPHLMYKALI